MVLLETLDWGHVWMVTLVGFGIVLCLLVVLVYILKLFGWTMQRRQQEEEAKGPNPLDSMPRFASNERADEITPAVIAMALAMAKDDDEMAAVAMALYLYHNDLHDIQNTRLTMTGHSTAWNAKSFGMNNLGF